MDFIRIYETLNPTLCNLIQVAFTRNGIRYRILHEETMQIANMVAMGNTGAIIEVASNDFLLAKHVLKQMDIVLDYPVEKDRFESVTRLDTETKQIPFLKRIPLGNRYLIIIGIGLILLFVNAIVMLLRIDPAALPDNRLAIQAIHVNGELLQPNTSRLELLEQLGIQIDERDKINIIEFTHDGIVHIDNYSSFVCEGYWELSMDKKQIIFSAFGELPQVFNGVYDIHRNWFGNLRLESPTTTIRISLL